MLQAQRKTYFRAIGRFLGLCFWFRYTIPLMVCRHVAKYLLGRYVYTCMYHCNYIERAMCICIIVERATCTCMYHCNYIERATCTYMYHCNYIERAMCICIVVII